MYEVDRKEIIDCMLKNKDECDICFVKDADDKIQIFAHPNGLIETYCNKNGCVLLDKFYHNPLELVSSKDCYHEIEADFELECIEFNNIQIY